MRRDILYTYFLFNRHFCEAFSKSSNSSVIFSFALISLIERTNIVIANSAPNDTIVVGRIR